MRHTQIQRLTAALRDHRRNLSTNRAQLLAIVNDLAPGLTDQPGIGPVNATQVIVSFSHRHCPVLVPETSFEKGA